MIIFLYISPSSFVETHLRANIPAITIDLTSQSREIAYATLQPITIDDLGMDRYPIYINNLI